MPNIFFTGCTHFGHFNIIKFGHRPYTTSEEMDAALIENWNKVVGRNDTVYHLGDFTYKGKHNQTHYTKQLNGKLIVLRGNHDPAGIGEPYMELRDGKRKIVLCHYPFEEWNGWFQGALHFHAHTHKPEFVSAERRGHVGVDACGYAPIELSEAIEKLK